MPRDMIPIYDGAMKANRIGSFIRGGETFDIVRPGYDSQGRRHQTWTQFVHDGIPVYEVKTQVDADTAIDRFEAEWKKIIGDDSDLLKRALEAVKKERRSRFQDNKTGLEPAPAVSVDGRKQGKNFAS